MVIGLKKVQPLELGRYIHFGQYTHPRGSGQPPLAADECGYCTYFGIEINFLFWIMLQIQQLSRFFSPLGDGKLGTSHVQNPLYDFLSALHVGCCRIGGIVPLS